MSTQVFVPDDFYCPIIGELMVDPVSDTSGNTFEKSAIHRWLSSHSTNPMDRTPLTISDLNPNPTVKKSIDQIRDKLTSEQLKIQSRIHESQSKNFTDGLDQIRMESHIFENKLFVSVKMPDNSERAPVDLVLCIDVSGSMGTEAVLKGPAGETVHNGISVLALTVTAAKTIMSVLNDQDRISIITYTDGAKVIVSSMECSDSNKMAISTQLDQLRPLNTTNLWSGIHESLKTLKTTSPVCRQKIVLCSTRATVDNTDPVVTAMSISPSSGAVGDTLTCSGTATEANKTCDLDDGTDGTADCPAGCDTGKSSLGDWIRQIISIYKIRVCVDINKPGTFFCYVRGRLSWGHDFSVGAQ